jgi:hypothetical protein
MPRFRSPLLKLLLLAPVLASCAGRNEARPGPAASNSSPTIPSAPPTAAPTVQVSACPIVVPPIAEEASASIQAAIDAATTGQCAEVRLSPAVYQIKAPIHLRSYVRFGGQAFNHSFSVIRPTRDFQGRALLTTDYDFSSRERKQSNVTVEKIHLLALADCTKKQNCAPAAVGLFLDKTAYPTVNECAFSGFPDGGAAIRGGGVLYLKVTGSKFNSVYGWSLDFSTEFAPKRPGTEKPATYYAISVGNIEGNYFASRRGVRVEPGFAVTVRNNQFEGGLSMVHAFRTPSSVFAVESNYFEVSSTPQDVPDLGTITLQGTGRVVGNLINGPARGGQPFFVGPGIDIVGSEAMTIADNTIRCFDPGVRVRGTQRDALTQFGNVVAPRKRIRQTWDAPILMAPPAALGGADDNSDQLNRLPLTSPDQ